MAQLAIRGHATRGREVIEILTMLGGENKAQLNGTAVYMAYYICSEGYIDTTVFTASDKCYKGFTLEEFLEKYPYKIGDSVSSKYLKNYKIEKAEWESCNNRVIYKLQGMGWYSVEDLQPYKEETMDRKYNVEEYLKVWEETEKGLEVVVNDRFELKEDNGKFYIIKKQPEYPKTYEECCEILNWNHRDYDRVGYNSELLCKLQVLLLCRDAYWKIAGERMGLSEPWVLPFNENQDSKPMYFIVNKLGKIYKDNANIIINNRILAFPTKEMRDIFYENFKDLIEDCKELL